MISKNKKVAIASVIMVMAFSLVGFKYNQDVDNLRAEVAVAQQANEELLNQQELDKQSLAQQAQQIETLTEQNAELTAQVEEYESRRVIPVSRGERGVELGTVELTAYEEGGNCANGMPAVYGVVAVDPNFIPLGSTIYIEVDGMPEYNGTYVAADTGGAVRGNIIDICMPDNHYVFGRRSGRAWLVE